MNNQNAQWNTKLLSLYWTTFEGVFHVRGPNLTYSRPCPMCISNIRILKENNNSCYLDGYFFHFLKSHYKCLLPHFKWQFDDYYNKNIISKIIWKKEHSIVYLDFLCAKVQLISLKNNCMSELVTIISVTTLQLNYWDI